MTDAMQAGDAEAYVIGAAMSGYPDMDELASLLDPGDFYNPLNEAAWAAILRVHRAGNQPDPLSVRLALAEAEVRFDPTRLIDLAQSVPTVASAPYYAGQVALAAGMRRIHAAGVKVTQIGSQVGLDIEEARELARSAVDEATRGRSVSRARTLADILPSVIDTAQNGRGEMLSTPWPDVDRLIGGIAPGRLLIVGARPGVGKSIMGANLAQWFADRHGHGVLFSSMEMPEAEVGQRMLASYADANLTGLQSGTTDERTWGKIAARLDTLGALPIRIDDTPDQSVTHIRKAARDFQRVRDDLALIIVDYLQLVRLSDPRMSRVEGLGEVSRGLKLLARESGACVVAMAQVNREGAKHGDGRPRMSDLRESGSIEADADQVMLLHQPDDTVPEVEVIVDKNRHGPRGVAALRIAGHYARLDSITRHEYEQTS